MTQGRRRARTLLALPAALLAIALAGVLVGLVGPPWESTRRSLPAPGTTPLPLPAMPPVPDGSVRVLAAGDIGVCGSLGTLATGRLIDADPEAVVLALGDLAYERGSPVDFARCYDPAWGAARQRTVPVAGNHEHGTPGAAGYVGYFGPTAGDPGAPWRSIELGAWRLLLLDSECDRVGGCGEGSAQLAWLRAELAALGPGCSLAVWHRARFSSGPHGSDPATDPLWRAIASAGVDILLSAHDHTYERFAPLGVDGAADDLGTRAWVVGTGGAALYRLGEHQPGSAAAWDRAHGVLELTLHPGRYDWRFLAAMGEPFEDAGTGTC